MKTKKDLIPKGHAFSVVLITEAVGNKLLKFRSPLTSIKWDGDWSTQSKLWDQKLKQSIGEEHFNTQNNEDVVNKDENDMTFWMSY